ncbi:elgicin/penisin family lantibiotic [Longirhabdus pacifica]|uniref:elgicin/penisin family lantibiotic n=1 Tax=Longirhabdus pacifica TaxID=2305227 RepID=UPI001008AB49
MANNPFDLQLKLNKVSGGSTIQPANYTINCPTSSCYTSRCHSSTCYSSRCYTGQNRCGYTSRC